MLILDVKKAVFCLKMTGKPTCAYSSEGLNDHPLVVIGACGSLKNVEENLLEEHLHTEGPTLQSETKSQKTSACLANAKQGIAEELLFSIHSKNTAGGHAFQTLNRLKQNNKMQAAKGRQKSRMFNFTEVEECHGSLSEATSTIHHVRQQSATLSSVIVGVCRCII